MGRGKDKKEGSQSYFTIFLLGIVTSLIWSAIDRNQELDHANEEIKQLKQAQMQSKVMAVEQPQPAKVSNGHATGYFLEWLIGFGGDVDKRGVASFGDAASSCGDADFCCVAEEST